MHIKYGRLRNGVVVLLVIFIVHYLGAIFVSEDGCLMLGEYCSYQHFPSTVQLNLRDVPPNYNYTSHHLRNNTRLTIDSQQGNMSQRVILRKVIHRRGPAAQQKIQRTENKTNTSATALIVSQRLAAIARANYHRKEYNLLISPRPCSKEETSFLVVVNSVPWRVTQRKAIRETWGNKRHLGVTSRLVFLLGRTKEGRHRHMVETAIEMESREHQDIIRYDFQEDYYNLTVKSVLMLRWTSVHCKNARYLLKADDDMWVNFANLKHQLNLLNFPKSIIGNLWGIPPYRARPHRRLGSKYFVPWTVYPGATYPSFASGTCYAMTVSILPQLLENCQHRAFLHLEDVFVTGLCAVGVQDLVKVRMGGFISARFPLDSDKVCYTLTAHRYDLRDMRRIEDRCGRLHINSSDYSPERQNFRVYFPQSKAENMSHSAT